MLEEMVSEFDSVMTKGPLRYYVFEDKDFDLVSCCMDGVEAINVYIPPVLVLSAEISPKEQLPNLRSIKVNTIVLHKLAYGIR